MSDGGGLYLPEDGTGELYGPDGSPISRSELGEESEESEVPTSECDYCGEEEEKRRVIYPSGETTWRLPEGWRELPNGLVECGGCRPVRDAETGEYVRPPEEMR